VRFWVSFRWFDHCIITSFIFMHDGLYWEFPILRLIVEIFNFGKGMVAMIELCAWLLCNWQFGILTQQMLA
jgi:hypothetical protein